MFTFFCDVLNSSSVDANDNCVGQLYMMPFKHFLIVVIEQLLVVLYAVTHTLISGVYIQTCTKRLVEHVYHIEGSCVLIKIHVQFFVLHGFLATVFVQQLVAVFKRTFGQKQTALLLMVIDIGLNTWYIEAPLCMDFLLIAN